MMSAVLRRVGVTGVVLVLAVFSGIVHDGHNVAAADNPRAPWMTSKIQGTPVPPAPYTIRPLWPNLSFSYPTSLEELPGERMLVSEIGGSVYTFVKDSPAPQKKLVLKIDGAELWHATASLTDPRQWQLFVCYSKDGTSFVSRFRVDDTVADPQSEVVILTWPAGGHNAGCLRFGTDGMLYIATGDGSGPNPPDGRTAAQDVSNLFGCILRIDVWQKDDGRNYAVPPDNPFIDLDGARPEIWAYGLRNPWKFGIDRKTGRIFAADNGWESWEMVHEVVRGGNCGWPIMEGRAVLRSEVEQGPTPIRPPVKDHSHTEANSVIGGPVYQGTLLSDLSGTFVYGDYITGTIWGLKSDGRDSYTHTTLVDTDQRIIAFAEGSAGELFVLDYDFTGQIYALEPSDLEDNSAEFPRQLSDTGLFTSVETMTAAPGIVPYDVIVERWTDGARAKRWVAIPDSGTITLREGRNPARYPDGTVFVKHLTMPEADASRPPLPLETQILHYEKETWRPYSYVWDEDRRDAVLADAAGTDRALKYTVHSADGQGVGTDDHTWHVSAENECRLCHNAGSGFVLGFVPNQLDVARPASRGETNQLAQLAAKDVISSSQSLSGSPGRLVDPHDESQSLNDRARSYLHGNCGACHHPGGNAIVSFYLRRDLSFDNLNTNKGTQIGTFGLGNAKLLVPGDPYRSVLLYRMAKLGYARMPYIGSRVVDSRGVSLIDQWIRSLPRNDSEEEISQVLRYGSPEQLALTAVNADNNEQSQVRATGQLLESTAGALALSIAVHRGTARHVDTAEAYATGGSDIRGLFETFIPEKERRQTLGRNFDPGQVLSLSGDAGRGRLIFYSDGARCRNCHDVNDAEKSTGPTLEEIRKKYSRRSELLMHILKPSFKVDEKFATWAVVMESGKVLSGLLVSQQDDVVVLKTAERKTVRIARSEIEEMKKSPQSLMPEGILADQTAQEAADLLAWFGSEGN